MTEDKVERLERRVKVLEKALDKMVNHIALELALDTSPDAYVQVIVREDINRARLLLKNGK